MSSSADFTSGWLGTSMTTCGGLPSLTRGSDDSASTPLLLMEPMVELTCRSFHRTLSLVVSVLPSGWVTVTISGDFSPGAMPGPFACVACMDATGIFFRSTLGLKTAQPLIASSAAHERKIPAADRLMFWRRKLALVLRRKTGDLKLLMADSVAIQQASELRSEERRVRKECRS